MSIDPIDPMDGDFVAAQGRLRALAEQASRLLSPIELNTVSFTLAVLIDRAERHQGKLFPTTVDSVEHDIDCEQRSMSQVLDGLEQTL